MSLAEKEEEHIFRVILDDDAETMAKLLENGLNPNAYIGGGKGLFPLTVLLSSVACLGRVHPRVTKVLLDYGANPYTVYCVSKTIAYMHSSPQLEKGGREFAEMLLQYDPYLPTIREGFKYNEFEKK